MSGLVWLVGMPGSGKSTVGEALARSLGCAFADVDREVEGSAGMTVEEVFAAEGEDGFRDRESTAIARLAGSEGAAVVACGGGAILDPANRDAMRASGTVVLLEAPLETLAARTGADGGRPLLREAGDLHRLLQGRSRAYREAAHAVVDADAEPDEVARRVEEALK